MSKCSRAFEPVLVEMASGHSPVLFVCEHASAEFPEMFGDLGTSLETRESHAAWDPGALAVARLMADHFGAPLVYGGVSRLLYDCNRSPEAADAIPPRSEIHVIPGNANLGAREREERIETIYRPFERALSRTIDETRPEAIVTVHSFTPIYFGVPRSVEVGLLHDRDSRLADRMIDGAGDIGFKIERNQPYGPGDGVMHTLRKHGEGRGLLNVMIEIRNDLVADTDGCERIAGQLSTLLSAAIFKTSPRTREAS